MMRDADAKVRIDEVRVKYDPDGTPRVICLSVHTLIGDPDSPPAKVELFYRVGPNMASFATGLRESAYHLMNRGEHEQS